MNKTELRKKLNQPYDQQQWKDVVEFVFPYFSEFAGEQNLPIEPKDKDKVESFKQLGTVRLADGKNLALFELKLKENVNLLRNRVALNDIVAGYIDQEKIHGVLSVFEQGKDDYRFTFAARASEFDEDAGDFKNKKTDTKRFTYVLGKNESCRTAAERFFQLSEQKEKADIDAIEKAFSVETLSKNFFKEYKQQYDAFAQYLTNTPSYFTAVFNNDDKAIRDFVKLLLGRLVFIKFVQKKGWLGVPATETDWENGNYRFIEESFEGFKHQDNFYSQFLNPLFFEGFDQPNRPNDVFELTNTKIPFLSGGLFDNEDPKTKTINFPKAYFESLFDFLERYNFTIDENDTSMDREVGIDPEMLGHIFENLLEDNKDKGAFYTPKEIVRYMCQESLKEYLKTYLQEQNQWSNDEAKQKELEEDLHDFVTKKEAGKIIDFESELATALKTVKICDPAIGSGAFPMGLLNEIFQLVYKLYDASPDKVGKIWEMDSWKPDKVKLNIIQQSIYGVDIEKGAVDIARLRFWLSLVVDSKEPQPLPHLDYKIVVGNSLVSKFNDIIININWKAEEKNQDLFQGEKTEKQSKLIERIKDLQFEIFQPDSDEEALSLKLKDAKIDLLILQLELMREEKDILKRPRQEDYLNKNKTIYLKDVLTFEESDKWRRTIIDLEKLKMQDIVPLAFFDWQLDFPEVMNSKLLDDPGFDIVIGNPPYVQLQKGSGKLAKDFENCGYETFTRMGDVYSLFYEKGFNLLKKEGNLIYITSNKWMKTGYGKLTRMFFTEKTQPITLIDFAGQQIFETATVDTNILQLKRTTNCKPIKACIVEEKWKTSLVDYVKNNSVESEFKKDDAWVVLNPIEQQIKAKIDKYGIPLSEWDINIYRGVLTGYNEAFIIDEATKELLIKEDPKSAEIIRPILRGRDVLRYGYKNEGLFIINSHNGNPTKKIKPIKIENYPAIHKHLNKYITRLTKRTDQGITPFNLRSCIYLDDFSKQKIIWAETMRVKKSQKEKFPRFGIDLDKGVMLDKTCFFATGESIIFLIGILNSFIGRYLCFRNVSVLDDGGYLMQKSYIQEIKVPKFSKDLEALILNRLMDNENYNELEIKIDNKIAQLYELTQKEVQYIKNFFNP